MQNYQIKDQAVASAFKARAAAKPLSAADHLRLSWSNWGFGMEDLRLSAARLARHGIAYIELHGNHYGPDLGYKPCETKRILADAGLAVSGVCGMFSPACDMASNNANHRQAAIDYIRREVDFTHEMGGSYLLVVPAAVGRPAKYDDMELARSIETLRIVADCFTASGVRAAIEPIRAAETSIVHTVKQAREYIAAVDHPGIAHINGDVFHMMAGESHIGEAILEAGSMLANLHLADSNRCALGEGAMDVDTMIRALYVIGYTANNGFVSPEPLGPGGDPYPAMYGRPDADTLEHLVAQTARYFKEREAAVLAEA